MLLMLSAPGWQQHRARIAEFAIQHGLPAMFIAKHYVEAGGLISYGADLPGIFRKGADYVAKILKGAKPADLPVEQATKFELVVRSEEHTSELQSLRHLVCRLLLEKKKKKIQSVQ